MLRHADGSSNVCLASCKEMDVEQRSAGKLRTRGILLVFHSNCEHVL